MYRSPLDSTTLPADGFRRAAMLDDGRFAVAAVLPPAALTASLTLPSDSALALFFMLYFGIAAIVLRCAAQAGMLFRFGWANRVTWIRTALAAVVAGATIDAGGDVNWWIVSALAALVLALDGLDGLIARRQGQASRFGALFDQEVDAGFILILCLLLALSGKIGFWIVALGAIRYLFLAAGWVWHVLARPLPPSAVRSAVCAVQIAALLIALLPPVAPIAAGWIGGGALGVLVLSFARDVLWLLGQPQPEKHS